MELNDVIQLFERLFDAGLVWVYKGLLSLEGTLQHSVILEHFGAITAAITGVLAARSKKIDIFGVLVLGFVTAVGGGTVRDLCLSAKIWWVEDPNFTISIVLTCLVTFFIVRIVRLPKRALDVADAFTLALFTVVGAWKAIEYHTGFINAVMMGVITGVVGGMTRDILLGIIPNVLRPGIYLYATASACGSIIYVIAEQYGLPYKWVLSIGTILILRLGAMKWKLSLPEYHDTDEPGPQNPS